MRRKLTIIADTHASENEESADKLFVTLDEISKSDSDVVFLGDIFDLWIALPGYENDIQQRFVQWCQREQGMRHLYFIEGNHEYYVLDRYKSLFCAAAKDKIIIDGTYFSHGHLISGNCLSFNHIFDFAAKSFISRWLMRVMPGGKRLARFLQRVLAHRADASYNPAPLLEQWMKKMPNLCYVVGHFHQNRVLQVGEKRLQIVYGIYSSSSD